MWQFIFDHTYIRICVHFRFRGPFVRAAAEPMEMRCPAVCQPWPPATHNDPCVSVEERFSLPASVILHFMHILHVSLKYFMMAGRSQYSAVKYFSTITINCITSHFLPIYLCFSSWIASIISYFTLCALSSHVITEMRESLLSFHPNFCKLH